MRTATPLVLMSIAATAFGGPQTHRLHLTDAADPALGADPPEHVFAESPIAPDGTVYLEVAQGTGFDIGPRALWTWRDGVYTEVFDTETAIDGLPGLAFDGAFAMRMNASGEVTFEAGVRALDGYVGRPPAGAIVTITEGGPEVIAVQGDDAPTGGTYDFLYPLGVDANGSTFFNAQLRDHGEFGFPRALVASDGVTDTVVVSEGLPAPGLPSLTITHLWGDRVGDSGLLLFNAIYDDGEDVGVPGLWMTREGEIIPLAVGVGPSGDALESAGTLGINAHDEVLFGVILLDAYDPNVPFVYPGELYVHSDGENRLVARTGDEAPGTAGANFGNLATSSAGDGNTTVFNNAGDVLFVADLVSDDITIDTTNDSGIWLERDGVLELIIREGDAIPGVTQEALGATRAALMNDSGHVVFSAGFADEFSIDNGLWAYIADEQRFLEIARAGELFDVSVEQDGSDMRTVSYVQDAYNTLSLNDNGQLLFQLRFTDGTWGNFVTTIPAPGAFALFGLAGVAWRRRRV